MSVRAGVELLGEEPAGVDGLVAVVGLAVVAHQRGGRLGLRRHYREQYSGHHQGQQDR